MLLSKTLSGRQIKQKCQHVVGTLKKLPETSIRFISSSRSCYWRVMFFGNDLFSLESVKALVKHQESNIVTRLEVVTTAAKDNPVTQYALRNNIPSHRWPFDSSNISNFDLGVVASFGYLIPEDIISKFPLGIVNVHASLLPRWRGASPISYAILHGDSKTGITLMQVKPFRFDVGEIISQAEVEIERHETFLTLLNKLSIVGANELSKCIIDLPYNLAASKAQDASAVTYAPKITKAMAEINFETMDAGTIYTLDRAISYLFPLSTHWLDIPVKLLGVCPSTCSTGTTAQPGCIHYNKKTKKMNVECSKRTFITFSKIILSKRIPMSPIDFYNGYLSKVPQKQRFFKLKN